MCVGALLQADADGLVYALADPVEGACGSAVQPCRALADCRAGCASSRASCATTPPTCDRTCAPERRRRLTAIEGGSAALPGGALLYSAAERCPSG